MLAFETWLLRSASFPRTFRHAVRRCRSFPSRVARLAVRSLYGELSLYPKPGLVSLVDNGSHADMTAATFMRSLFALRGYFKSITRAGMDGESFAVLKRLGIDAERRMLRATGGVNTHRGAIFCLGLLCAAIGHCHAQRISPTPQAVREALLAQYGAGLRMHLHADGASSNGLRVAALHAASGAREEAALGLPSLFEVALPTFRETLAAGRTYECASIDALFVLMAHISDTNVYHRGGAAGAEMTRAAARDFLRQGATANATWQQMALDCHHAFINRRLSPGGAADLLAATLLVDQVAREFAPGA